MKLTLLALACAHLVCCAGIPATLSIGLTGKTQDGTAYHVDVNAPIQYGAKVPMNVSPAGK